MSLANQTPVGGLGERAREKYDQMSNDLYDCEQELKQAKARQRQSDLNYTALEKQNTRLAERIDAQAKAICLASDKLMEAKAENARLRELANLSAWVRACDESRIGIVLPVPQVIRDLLAPTIRVLEEVAPHHTVAAKELERLRAKVKKV